MDERSSASRDWRERAAALVDPDREPATLPTSILSEVFAHARECYPEECCGILTGPNGGTETEAVRCTNVQNLRRSEGESELDARQGFWIDEQDLYRALREAEARGHELLTVYHSHTDTEAYLSKEDLRGALGPDGRPLWPSARQLVVSVQDGKVRAVALFEWDASTGAYAGRGLRPRV